VRVSLRAWLSWAMAAVWRGAGSGSSRMCRVRGVTGCFGGMQCPPGLFDLDVGGLFGRVGHHPVRVVAGGAVAVVGVEVEVDAGVAVVVFLAPA